MQMQSKLFMSVDEEQGCSQIELTDSSFKAMSTPNI